MIEGADTCPFCKREPEWSETVEYGSPSSYVYSKEYITIRCSECHSQLERVTLPIFTDCSNYTVQDFRDDSSLHPQVNKILEQRIADTKSNLLVKWNKRKP